MADTSMRWRARGQQALEELFPGLTAELVADGALAGSLLADARMYLSGHRLRQTDTGLVLLCASRPFLEAHVRARVRAHPNVTVLDRCDVVGLATTSDTRRVTGARVLRRADSSAEEVLTADLVVDASGRGSRAPVWLESLGYPGRSRCGLGSPMRLGSTDVRPTLSTATWQSWTRPRRSFRVPVLCLRWRAIGGC